MHLLTTMSARDAAAPLPRSLALLVSRPVQREVSPGVWYVHTDPKGDPELRKKFDKALREQEERMTTVRHKAYVVDDEWSAVDGIIPIIASFDTADEAAIYIGGLEDYETGRYGITGPADD